MINLESLLWKIYIFILEVNYNEKGVQNHLPLLQSDFNNVYCLKAIKEFNVKGRIISEGSMVEKDALLLEETYKRL